jgi:cytochrome c oxidase assembly factor CtaG
MRRRAPAALAAAALLAVPAVAAAHGGETHGTSAEELRHDWMGAWSVPWPEVVLLAVALGLYAMAARRVRGRLPWWRAASFVAGLGVLLFAAASPIDAVGERGLFWVHMVQHVLIGDIAAFLLVLGVTGPILQPALRYRWVQRLRVLTHPVVALAVWALVLVAWHLPVLYEASLTNEFVHALEHMSFLVGGILMWATLLETLPAPEWFGTGAKLAFIGGVRVVDAILANAFWWAGTAFYATYEQTAPLWGISAVEDQGHAGTVMMAWTGTVTLIVATVLFFRMAREGEMRQQLIEKGLDPQAVRRAVRYGRGEVLAARHGIVLEDIPGG